MKVYKRSRGINPPILNSDTRWKLVINFSPGNFTPGKENLCPLHGRPSHRIAGLYGLAEEIYLLYLAEFEPRTVQPVANRYTD